MATKTFSRTLLRCGRFYSQKTVKEQVPLPSRIPTGGTDSPFHENGNGNGDNGNGTDNGDMLVIGWKEKHASTSEAIVKAERHGDNITTEELQKKTVEHLEKKIETTDPDR